MKREVRIGLMGVLGILLFMESAIAANIIGISPGNVYFRNVLRGGYAERYITVTQNSDEEVGVFVEARGYISEWLNFSSNFSVSKGRPYRLLLSIMPPKDIPNGNYSGFLRFYTGPMGNAPPEGGATGFIRAVIDVSIEVEVVDFEIKSCKAKDFNIYSAEKGENIIFETSVLNEGNIRIIPEVILNVWDKEQISVVKRIAVKGSNILPTREEKLRFNISSADFQLDQYWATIEVPDCFSVSNTLTFDVLEPGTLRAEGVLLRILSKTWVDVDETVPIVAEFKNIGEKKVGAQFRGQITYNGKIIQILESEKRDVPIFEMANFTFFLTPKKAGKYIVNGRVHYDRKITYELSSVINARKRKIGIREIFLWAVYLSLLLFIGVLIYKIRKEKGRLEKRIEFIKKNEY